MPKAEIKEFVVLKSFYHEGDAYYPGDRIALPTLIAVTFASKLMPAEDVDDAPTKAPPGKRRTTQKDSEELSNRA